MDLRRPLLLLAPVLLAPSVPAEVHTVGPPGSGAGFETIQAAIDAAAAGDVVLVAPGDYEHFVLDKPLLVQGAGPGLTTVTGAIPYLSTAVRFTGIGAGEVAAIAGMTLQSKYETFLFQGSLVDVLPAAGAVILHDIATKSHASHPVVAALEAARMVFSRATLVTDDEDYQIYGLRTTSSRVWIVDSHLAGPGVTNPTSWLVDLHHTARVIHSELYLAGCTILGPDILDPAPYSGGDAIDAQVSLVVADRSTLLGGQGALDKAGGYGARLLGSSLFAGGDTLVQGGLDGPGLVEQEPVLGSGYVKSAAIRPTLSVSPPLVAPGGNLDVTLHGEPGATGALFTSLSPGAGAAVPGLAGDVFLDLAAPRRLGDVTLDAQGEAHLSFRVPALPEPTLATFQWAASASSIEISNPAFVSVP